VSVRFLLAAYRVVGIFNFGNRFTKLSGKGSAIQPSNWRSTLECGRYGRREIELLLPS
jgi:hypothetical protein